MVQNFASRITRASIPFDSAKAKEIGTLFHTLGPEITRVIEGAAGCSDYLSGLMIKEADWLRQELTKAPEPVLERLINQLDLSTLETLGVDLRQAKRRVALLTGLCDLAGVWPLMKVTTALTKFADKAVDLTIKRLVADEIRRGKLPGATPQDTDTAGGMFVLAMGKMGANELNYSSDIDLICLFDQERYGADWQDARASFIRVTRKMTAILSDITAQGYVFRTDLRLRPDASVMPVCLSMAAAEAYYEAQGRTWERAAYIKARPCAGDLVAADRFLTTLRPFIWRKHLDFAAIQDAHDMRLRIREHRGLNGPLVVEGHNLKLGVGGIREIEFFTQTRQLIAGGRDPSLRGRTTLGALRSLAEKGWVPDAVCQELQRHYLAHREVEHRLQMVGDEQTHDLPSSPKGVARIAAFCGQTEPAFRADLLERLARTDVLTDGFFVPRAQADAPEMSATASKTVEGWFSYPCLRSERAQAIFRRLKPGLLKSLEGAHNPEQALIALDQFFSGLPSGVQIFSLFEANPPLVDLIVDIAATAPALAQYLSRNASVLDAVIGGSFFAPWPERHVLVQELSSQLSDLYDYESKLDRARRWTKEWHFRIGVHHLRGLIDGFEAAKQYADLACAVITAIWGCVVAEFSAKHGPLPGRGAVVLGMGSLGAGRLNSGSDLDLILIYDASDIEASVGPKPLVSRSYYARLTQTFVTALSARMSEGRLYEVDVRLRPSGRQGPVATSISAFRDYQMNEAWTWEHLALTRARVLVGHPVLAAEVEAFRRQVLGTKGKAARVIADLCDMRVRLAAAKPGQGALEAKFGAGKLMDIELLAQMLALISANPAVEVERQLLSGGTRAKLSVSEQTILLKAYTLFWKLQIAKRLLSNDQLTVERLGDGGEKFLLRETGTSSMQELTDTLVTFQRQVETVLATQLKG